MTSSNLQSHVSGYSLDLFSSMAARSEEVICRASDEISATINDSSDSQRYLWTVHFHIVALFFYMARWLITFQTDLFAWWQPKEVNILFGLFCSQGTCTERETYNRFLCWKLHSEFGIWEGSWAALSGSNARERKSPCGHLPLVCVRCELLPISGSWRYISLW